MVTWFGFWSLLAFKFDSQAQLSSSLFGCLGVWVVSVVCMVLQLPTADKMSAPANPRVPKREQLTRELLPLNCCHFSAAVKNTLLQVMYENLDKASRDQKLPNQSMDDFFRREGGLDVCLKLRREQRESRPVKLRGSQWYLSYPSLLLQPVACARLVFILVASDQQLHRMVTRQDEV